MKVDGSLMIASYLIEHTMEPPEEEGAWIGIWRRLQEEEDPHRVRRRLREKTAVGIRALRFDDEQPECVAHQVRVDRIMQEEGQMLLEDEEEESFIIMQNVLRKIKQAAQVQEEDVLRTRVVSMQELLDEKELWYQPIANETSSEDSKRSTE